MRKFVLALFVVSALMAGAQGFVSPKAKLVKQIYEKQMVKARTRGEMVSDQMRTFRPGFKFPGSFNDLKQVESDPEKRKAALELRVRLIPVFPRGTVPKKYRYVESLPRNPQGKILAAELTKMFAERGEQ